MSRTSFLPHLLVFFLAACSPLPSSPASISPSDSASPIPTQQITQATVTLEQPQKTLEETSTMIPVTATPTEIPKAIDEFYKTTDFSGMLRTYFGADFDNMDISAADYNAQNGIVALTGCISVCSDVMGGYSFLVLLNDDPQKAPIAIPIELYQKTFDVDFTPDGELLFYSVYGKVMAYDVSSNSTKTAWTNPMGQTAPFNNISPDGKYLAIYANTQFSILDLASLKEVLHIPNATVRSRQTPVFNEQSNRLTVFADELHKITVYDIPTWQVISEITLTDPGTAAISPDGKTAAISTLGNPEIKLIDLESQMELWTMKPAFEPLSMMKINPDGSLLFISGMADETADMEENTWFLDTSSGENKGGLLTMDPPSSLHFSEDGKSLMFFDGSKYSISHWGPKTEEMVKIEEILRKYFEAINQKDYAMAASLTELNSYAMDEVKAVGLDPNDLAGTFATLCKEDSVPCLPLGQIVAIYADVTEEWDFMAYVTLIQPDGSEVLFDDITRYERIWVAKDGQGGFIITDLHPGMRYPYE